MVMMLATIAGAAGCRQDTSLSAAPSAWLLIETTQAVQADAIEVQPRGLVQGIFIDGKILRIKLALTGAAGIVRVQSPGLFCPVSLATGELKEERVLRRKAVPWWDFDAPQPQVGFDRAFAIEVRPACDEAKEASSRSDGQITWTSVATPSVPLTVEPGGLRVTGRTQRWQDALGLDAAALPWGIIPIGPRTRGDASLLARWQVAGRSFSRTAPVAAAVRSLGLPSMPVGTRVHLGGQGWKLLEQPGDGHGALLVDQELTSLLLEVPGAYRLRDGRGHDLQIIAGRHDEVPLDCGRIECHPRETRQSQDTAMTQAWARLLSMTPEQAAQHGAADDIACAVACHTVGEPGLDDGGFEHTLRLVNQQGGNADPATAHSAAFGSRALRRQAGVGCFACHGPAAIPPPDARWAVLRTAICATCHDGPPRYGHVAAWTQTRMANTTTLAPAMKQPAHTGGKDTCVDCHTTWGFLGAPERQPPTHVSASGITCVACHDVHGPAAATQPALLRDVPLPPSLQNLPGAAVGKSRICLTCHAPQDGSDVPRASAASLWAGHGGLDPETGEKLAAPAPHLTVKDGCLGCHRGGNAPVQRGANHTFAVDRKACLACHPQERAVPVSSRLRAQGLWRRWQTRTRLKVGSDRLPHAGKKAQALDLTSPAGRAAWNVLLVLEDPAADQHNAAFARLLLDRAAVVLGEPEETPAKEIR